MNFAFYDKGSHLLTEFRINSKNGGLSVFDVFIVYLLMERSQVWSIWHRKMAENADDRLAQNSYEMNGDVCIYLYSSSDFVNHKYGPINLIFGLSLSFDFGANWNADKRICLRT